MNRKISKALNHKKVILLGGISRPIAIVLTLILIISLFYGTFTQKIVGCIIVSIIWIILTVCYSYDYLFFSLLLQYFKQPDFYLAYSEPDKIPLFNKIKNYINKFFKYF